jgi:hypothetical protein
MRTVLVGVTALVCFAQGPERGAAISGRVVGSDGKPVAGIALLVTPAAVKAGEANPGVFTATSGADGTYSVGSLPAGEYNICASDEGGRLVNPCTWSGPVAVTLAAGQSRTGVQLQMEAAGEVVVEIRDPGQRLASGAHSVMVGIPAPYIFVAAAGDVRTAGLRTYRATVPLDREIDISIVTGTLALTDEAGKELKKGEDMLRVRVPRGQGEKTVVVNVAGVVDGK